MNIRINPEASAIEPLLLAAGLPVDDLPADLHHFLFLGSATTPTGVVGLEPYGAEALLRSLVVRPAARKNGLGGVLLEAAEDHAKALRVRDLYLLTESAEAFFADRGWQVISRSEAPAAIKQTRQFAELCPDNATFMTKSLTAPR